MSSSERHKTLVNRSCTKNCAVVLASEYAILPIYPGRDPGNKGTALHLYPCALQVAFKLRLIGVLGGQASRSRSYQSRWTSKADILTVDCRVHRHKPSPINPPAECGDSIVGNHDHHLYSGLAEPCSRVSFHNGQLQPVDSEPGQEPNLKICSPQHHVSAILCWRNAV